MTRIGLLSDTHGYLDPKVFEYFKECDEIWHAGDFGNADVSNQLSSFKPLKGVFGNIDGTDVRILHPLSQHFLCEQVSVLMIHIGGSPANYYPEARKLIEQYKPALFICGHSHICKVQHDKKNRMLYMNPGAAGIYGVHKIRTLLRFTIIEAKIQNLEVIELVKHCA